MDGANGTVLYAQNADARCYPASVTKLMTLVLILEAVDEGRISLTDTVTVSEDAAGMGGSQVYLYAGETRTVEEMIIAIAVGSGNDAAYAMAEFVGGAMPAFVDMMNVRAKELGLSGTNFVNPHGLHDENHYTTAKDMATLAYHALQIPHMLEYTSIYEYEFRPEPRLLVLWNTNRLLKWYDGTDGFKTGYTPEAGRSLVTTAKRGDLRLISVVMGVEDPKGHFTESMKLLNYGFNTYEFLPILSAADIVARAQVAKGMADEVDLMLADDLGLLVKKGEKPEITKEIITKNNLPAPLAQGDDGGEVVIFRDGEEILRAKLIVGEDVARISFGRMWKKVLEAVI
jgi:D-alanyl-D-alanine carboxypeptidase (penicillin-binding protein 5/6)